MEYYASHPLCQDKAWLQEQDSVAEFCQGRGLDPGAGNRTFSAETVCLDMHPQSPEVMQGDATNLPFRDGEFDYVINSHLIEHLPNPRIAICEWLRVVKPGGHVCMIIPNTIHTNGFNSDKTPHRFEWSPREFVIDVLGISLGDAPWFTAAGRLSWCAGEVVLADCALDQWSFCVVIRKVAV